MRRYVKKCDCATTEIFLDDKAVYCAMCYKPLEREGLITPQEYRLFANKYPELFK